MSVSMVSPVFIGRQEEMTVLTAMLSQAADGVPAVALISGAGACGTPAAGSQFPAGFRCQPDHAL